VTTAQIDVLVTKHGFAEALQSVNAAFETLHAYFLDRLGAAANAGEIGPTRTPTNRCVASFPTNNTRDLPLTRPE
jgi:hypothetical protein